jgi:hypothetical protein
MNQVLYVWIMFAPVYVSLANLKMLFNLYVKHKLAAPVNMAGTCVVRSIGTVGCRLTFGGGTFVLDSADIALPAVFSECHCSFRIVADKDIGNKAQYLSIPGPVRES